MTIDGFAWAILACLAVGAGAVLLTLRSDFVLVVLLATRSLSDWYLLPDTVRQMLNAAIGMGAIGVAATRWSHVLIGLRARRFATALLLVPILWSVVAFLVYRQWAIGLYETFRCLSIVCMFSLALGVVQEYGRERVLRLVVVAAVPAAIVALVQMVISTGEAMRRASATFVHPNAAVVTFNVVVMLLLYVVMTGRRSWRRSILLAVFSLASVATLSLGGLAGLIVGIAVALTLGRESGAPRRLALLCAGSCCIAIAALTGPMSRRIAELRGSDVNSGREDANSWEWRLRNWSEYVDYFWERPLFGHGWGVTDSIVVPLGKQPHSEPVRFLVEIGLVGTVIVLVCFGVVSKYAIRAVTQRAEFGSPLVGVFAAVTVQATESNMLAYTASMWFVVVSVALVVRGCSKSDGEPVGEERVVARMKR